MNFYQSLLFINAHNQSMNCPATSEQHALSDNVSFSSNSTYSADEQVIIERGQKRSLSELDTNQIHDKISDDKCRSPRKFKRMRTSKSILRTPLKKRLKLMHDSRRKLKHKKGITSTETKHQLFKQSCQPERKSTC